MLQSSHDLQALASEYVDIDESESCSTCFEDVGADFSGDFIPFCVFVDDEDTWVICLKCAQSVL